MALKVFLVEDESVIRQGLRDNIPWKQYGYSFVGEASDGEMALPMIRKERPDVVITDIKMPFMDGLSLTHIVKKEMPDTRVIIISGYDDFEYARRAIEEGVEQYLLKPITRSSLLKALQEVREKFDQQEEQKNFLRKYQSEMKEYEQSFRRDFFEKVFEGQTSLAELYELASKRGLDINAPAYNIIFVSVTEKADNHDEVIKAGECQEEIMRFALKYSDRCVAFRWSINVYGMVIKDETEDIEKLCEKFMDNIKIIGEKYAEYVNWNAACGEVVYRLSQLSECYSRLNNVFSLRFLQPEINILTKDLLPTENSEGRDEIILGTVDNDMVSPEVIKGFLKTGLMEETDEFCENYVLGFGEVIKNRSFWDYMLLNIRFTVLGFVNQQSISSEVFLEDLVLDNYTEKERTAENLKQYIKGYITKALHLRDDKNKSQGKGLYHQAIEYVEKNFTNENLSLNSAAEFLGVSPNYLSATFSQEKGSTFIEYLTEKRMEKAKELLLKEGIKSGDVGTMVGYKNPQYFSFVFKKTNGCTPREYRAKNTEQ